MRTQRRAFFVLAGRGGSEQTSAAGFAYRQRVVIGVLRRSAGLQSGLRQGTVQVPSLTR